MFSTVPLLPLYCNISGPRATDSPRGDSASPLPSPHGSEMLHNVP